MGMNSDKTSKLWRKTFADDLQGRFGLAEKEAQDTANKLLRWLSSQPVGEAMAAAKATDGASHFRADSRSAARR